MSSTVFFFFLLLLLLLIVNITAVGSASVSAATADDLVTTTCTDISSTDPNIDTSFCIGFLTAPNPLQPPLPPHVKPHSVLSLALRSTRLAVANATRTRTQIKKLLRSPTLSDVDGRYVRGCLQDCLELYGDAVQQLRRTRRAVGSTVSTEAAEGAVAMMSSVVDVGTTCDDGFRNKDGVVNLMEKNDRDFFQIAVITLAIVKLC